MHWTRAELAKLIDHAVLHPTHTAEDVRVGAEIAREFAIAALIVKPCHVALAADLLAGSGVALGVAIGFPHGSHAPEVKAYEARLARDQGAHEFDMVINLGALLGGEEDLLRREISMVVEAAEGGLVKVILETAYLSDEQKVRACRLVEEAGAHFVKTSTGFGPRGATVEDVRLLRQSVSSKVRVKAAGGIRTLADALRMVEAGASRIGTSSTKTILEELEY
ncbi:MAG: deoxyribose-phosphate aldolase [Armatimonadota bacterium]|nr:deoxyribose-phosphate aldolase [Armatimonadota bacterium]